MAKANQPKPKPRKEILDLLSSDLSWTQDVTVVNDEGEPETHTVTLQLNNPTVDDTVKWTKGLLPDADGFVDLGKAKQSAAGMIAAITRQEHLNIDQANILLRRLGGERSEFFQKVMELFGLDPRPQEDDDEDELSEAEKAEAAEETPTE